MGLICGHLFEHLESVLKVALTQHARDHKAPSSVRKWKPLRLHIVEDLGAEEVVWVNRKDLQSAFAASCIELDLVLPAIVALDVLPESHLLEHLAQLSCRAIAGTHKAVYYTIVHLLVWRFPSVLHQYSTDVQDLIMMSLCSGIA